MPPNEKPSDTAVSCDVYVWGSNTSHQLAEGDQEKISTPKLAKTFTNVQQVTILSTAPPSVNSGYQPKKKKKIDTNNFKIQNLAART